MPATPRPRRSSYSTRASTRLAKADRPLTRSRARLSERTPRRVLRLGGPSNCGTTKEGQMSPATYQTIKLSKGKHASPEDGACVMELASMLAGEPFTDHPASVCPVVGSFLRAYNDSVDDERRQDLYAYAAQVVGSRASVSVQRERAERLAEWAVEV